MKKSIAFLSALLMAFSLSACGDKDDDESSSKKAETTASTEENTTDTETTTAETETTTAAEKTTAESENAKPTKASGSDKEQQTTDLSGDCNVTAENGELKILASKKKFKDILKEDCLICICPVGKYTWEIIADYACFDYTYNESSDDEDFIFTFDLESVEPGEYTMALCDSDSNGYVVAQWNAEFKENGQVDADLGNAVFNEAPKIESTASRDGKISCVKDGNSLTFNFDSSYPLQTNSWVGFCPVGTYTTEEQADDADVRYSYINVEDDGFSASFIISDIEPGEYSVVLCDNDDSGNVLTQWKAEIGENSEIKWDFN